MAGTEYQFSMLFELTMVVVDDIQRWIILKEWPFETAIAKSNARSNSENQKEKIEFDSEETYMADASHFPGVPQVGNRRVVRMLLCCYEILVQKSTANNAKTSESRSRPFDNRSVLLL